LVRDQNLLGQYGQRKAPGFSRIEAQVEEALRFDPRLGEAHASRGFLRMLQWRSAEAIKEMETAIALNPNYASAHQWLSQLLLNDGLSEKALHEGLRAAELDPYAPRVLSVYGSELRYAGRASEALTWFDRALALQSDDSQSRNFKIIALASLDRFDEALALARRIETAGDAAGLQLRVLAMAGRRAEAEVLLPEALANGRGSAVARATYLILLGRNEAAWSELAPEKISVASVFPELFFGPAFDPIRRDPRFVQLLETLGLTEAHARAQAWRAAHPPEKTAAK
jgi:tetratricopeptide (TPR) repeat protein